MLWTMSHNAGHWLLDVSQSLVLDFHEKRFVSNKIQIYLARQQQYSTIFLNHFLIVCSMAMAIFLKQFFKYFCKFLSRNTIANFVIKINESRMPLCCVASTEPCVVKHSSVRSKAPEKHDQWLQHTTHVFHSAFVFRGLTNQNNTMSWKQKFFLKLNYAADAWWIRGVIQINSYIANLRPLKRNLAGLFSSNQSKILLDLLASEQITNREKRRHQKSQHSNRYAPREKLHNALSNHARLD